MEKQWSWIQKHAMCEQPLNLYVQVYKIQCVIEYLIQTARIPCFCCMPLLSFGAQGQSRSKLQSTYRDHSSQHENSCRFKSVWLSFILSFICFFHTMKVNGVQGSVDPGVFENISFCERKSYMLELIWNIDLIFIFSWTIALTHIHVGESWSTTILWFHENWYDFLWLKHLLLKIKTKNDYSFKLLKVLVNALVEISFETLDWDTYCGLFLWWNMRSRSFEYILHLISLRSWKTEILTRSEVMDSWLSVVE